MAACFHKPQITARYSESADCIYVQLFNGAAAKLDANSARVFRNVLDSAIQEATRNAQQRSDAGTL